MTGLIDPSQIEYCRLCHLCPQPLGLCCFVWAALILLALILLVALTGRKYRCPVCGCRVKKRTKLCPDCGYNFITGEPPAYARHILKHRPAPAAPAVSAPLASTAALGSAAAETTAVNTAAPVSSAPAQAAARACPRCGMSLAEGARFCIGCGLELD